MSRRHTVMLFALAAIWGASFMFIKVAVRELEPLNRLRLGIRKNSGDYLVDAELPRDGVSRSLRVAGEHHDPYALRVKSTNRLGRALRQ